MGLFGLMKVAKDRFFLVALLAAPPVWLLIALTPWFPLPARSFTWPQLLVLGLLFPVLEEMAFRGLVQGGLLKWHSLTGRQLGFTGANGLTSLLFAAAHLFHQPPVMAALIFLPSLVFGELRDRFGLVWPSALLHVYYNFGLLLVLAAVKA